MRRQLSWVLTALIILLLVVGSAVSSLAWVAPSLPGDVLFSLQQWVEQTRLILVSDPTQLAERLLDLVERRLSDLEARIGTEHELAALTQLDEALNQAAAAIDATLPESHERLRARLATLAARLQTILRRLTVLPTTNPDSYTKALAKADALTALTNNSQATDTAVASIAAIDLGLPVTSPSSDPRPARFLPTHWTPRRHRLRRVPPQWHL